MMLLPIYDAQGLRMRIDLVAERTQPRSSATFPCRPDSQRVWRKKAWCWTPRTVRWKQVRAMEFEVDSSLRRWALIAEVEPSAGVLAYGSTRKEAQPRPRPWRTRSFKSKL